MGSAFFWFSGQLSSLLSPWSRSLPRMMKGSHRRCLDESLHYFWIVDGGRCGQGCGAVDARSSSRRSGLQEQVNDICLAEARCQPQCLVGMTTVSEGFSNTIDVAE